LHADGVLVFIGTIIKTSLEDKMSKKDAKIMTDRSATAMAYFNIAFIKSSQWTTFPD